MELAVLNTQGTETGRKVVLSDAVFGVEANDHAIYLDVKQYLADQRQGTHKSKQRNEVAGSTRKLKRQKGTGGARCGSIKSPLFPGGGRIFGPGRGAGRRTEGLGQEGAARAARNERESAALVPQHSVREARAGAEPLHVRRDERFGDRAGGRRRERIEYHVSLKTQTKNGNYY